MLTVADINRFDYTPSARFLSGQSQTTTRADSYVDAFAKAKASAAGFRSKIQSELTRLKSLLTPEQVIVRAQALSCGGCHKFNITDTDVGLPNRPWPPSLQFTHVDEDRSETGPDGARFPISPALKDVFLPHRASVLEEYLQKTAPLCRALEPCTTWRDAPAQCLEITCQ